MSNYSIVREVGKGGMGCVYEAKDPYGTRVALKMMSAKAAMQPDYRGLFDQEVQSLKKLSHPSIVKIVGAPFSDSSGNLFLPMEFIEGQTIAQIVKERGPYNEQEALEVFSKLLSVFSYIHGKACIHRDVKPSNIMIRPDGSVCVIDFGIAKDSKTSTGKTIGRIIGTDGYMSPEQANGYNIDHRTDIYSLGCLLHYMLSGSHAIPKQSNDYETVCAILDGSFPLLSQQGVVVSDRTQSAILKAVDKNMTLRFQTAEDFRNALIGENGDTASISVGRTGCDINMPGNYVSGYHLDILFDMQVSPMKVMIRDHSTNGTGVNGRKIKADTYVFEAYDFPSSYNPEYPQVMISGLPEFTLDWDKVADVLSVKTGKSVDNHDQTEDVTDAPDITAPVDTASDEKISVGYGILSFLVPIAGWILGAVWADKAPQKAKSANRLAWIGVIVGILFNGIISILTY